MVIRELTTKSEFERCVEIQRTEWGWGDLDVIPVRSFIVITHVGGITLGAFDGERVIGFINTMPGIREGAPYWFSRMLGVEREYRGRGVGTLLKRKQREFGLARGIRLIEWDVRSSRVQERAPESRKAGRCRPALLCGSLWLHLIAPATEHGKRPVDGGMVVGSGATG